MGFGCGALVVGLVGNYADIRYKIIPNQLNGLHKQKGTGNNIKILM